MRKSLLITFSVLLLTILVGCGKSIKLDGSDYTFEGNTYTYNITIDSITSDHEEVDSYINNTIYSIYDSLKEEIGNSKRYINLTITFSNEEKINKLYVVNQSLTSPGLKLIK